MIKATQLAKLAVKMSPKQLAEVASALQVAMKRHEINTPQRAAHFVAQLYHESRLQPQTENLYYSANRLKQVWPSRFTWATARQYEHKPEAIANLVYGGRMGNVDKGDGWRYRGRGYIQLTGRENYRRYGKLLGLPLEQQPDLLLNADVSALVAARFFVEAGCLPFADRNDVAGVTRRINGGLNGLAERRIYTNRLLKVFSEDSEQRVLLVPKGGGQPVLYDGKPTVYGGHRLPDVVPLIAVGVPHAGGPHEWQNLKVWRRTNGDLILERVN